MRPRLSVISIGVSDIERSVAFYRDGLGFPMPDPIDREDPSRAIAFFDLEDGQRLVVWTWDFMAADTQQPVGGAASVTLGHAVAERHEVDEVMDLARRAGARVVREPVELDWGGYSGYFADPDGHLWEVVWFPARYGWHHGRHVGS